MKLNNVTAQVSETEIEDIIKQAVESKTGLKVSSVSFKVGNRSVGYGMSERDESYFGGATITFEPGQTIKAEL